MPSLRQTKWSGKQKKIDVNIRCYLHLFEYVDCFHSFTFPLCSVDVVFKMEDTDGQQWPQLGCNNMVK